MPLPLDNAVCGPQKPGTGMFLPLLCRFVN
jgi:hypothetical protein